MNSDVFLGKIRATQETDIVAVVNCHQDAAMRLLIGKIRRNPVHGDFLHGVFYDVYYLAADVIEFRYARCKRIKAKADSHPLGILWSIV